MPYPAQRSPNRVIRAPEICARPTNPPHPLPCLLPATTPCAAPRQQNPNRVARAPAICVGNKRPPHPLLCLPRRQPAKTLCVSRTPAASPARRRQRQAPAPAPSSSLPFTCDDPQRRPASAQHSPEPKPKPQPQPKPNPKGGQQLPFSAAPPAGVLSWPHHQESGERVGSATPAPTGPLGTVVLPTPMRGARS